MFSSTWKPSWLVNLYVKNKNDTSLTRPWDDCIGAKLTPFAKCRQSVVSLCYSLENMQIVQELRYAFFCPWHGFIRTDSRDNSNKVVHFITLACAVSQVPEYRTNWWHCSSRCSIVKKYEEWWLISTIGTQVGKEVRVDERIYACL